MNDDKPGKPVEKLDADDPINRALGSIQLSANEIASTCWTFIEEFMGMVYRRGKSGVLDLKMTIVGDKLIIRRALRKLGEPRPSGKWWSLPLTPAVLNEYFERIKPEPPEPERPPLDVDASTAESAPTFSPAAMLRQRQRETAALVMNLRRTKDEIGGAGLRADFDAIESAMMMLEEALVIETEKIEAKETLQ